VEFLRSCYSSAWRLFRNCPESETPGIYYFVPEDTPCFPVTHYFGSRIWVTQERIDNPVSLGETNQRHTWSRGEAPIPLPKTVPILSPNCFQEGEGPPCPEPPPEPVVGAPCPPIRDNYVIRFGDCTGAFASLSGLVLTLPRVTDPPNETYFLDIAYNWPSGALLASVSLICQPGVTFLLVVQSSSILDPLIDTPPAHGIGPGPLTYNARSLPPEGGTVEATVYEETPLPLPYPEFSSQCYALGKKPIFNSRVDFLKLARIIQKNYANDPTDLDDAIALLSTSATGARYDNTASTVPGCVIAHDASQALVCIAGTSNFQQAAAQIAYGFSGIQDMGVYSTNFAWFVAATAIASRISSAGVNPGLPITLVGHSYGGAIAAVLATVFRNVSSTRTIRLITYGMPRPGDERMREILSSVPSTHLANFNDPIASIPSVGIELVPFVAITPPSLFALWSSVTKPGGQIIVHPDGGFEETERQTLLFAFFLEVMTLLIAQASLPAFTNHTIAEYVRRLELGVAP